MLIHQCRKVPAHQSRRCRNSAGHVSGASVSTTMSRWRIRIRSARAVRPVSMSSPGVHSEWRFMIRMSASVRPRKQAPEVSQGRKCRASIAIRYSSAWNFVTAFVRLATAHLIEQRSAPAASTAATACAMSSPTEVSASSRNVYVVVTAGRQAFTSRAGFGLSMTIRFTRQPSFSSCSAKAAMSGVPTSRATSTFGW